MIDQREVRHLIRQNKKIKEKIAEQARVYKEERQKLKLINRSLQKTLEDEKQKNRSTIEEFNAQIIALEAELRRVKSNEPEVAFYNTPSNRPIKPISFAQLEEESKRLAEETNRIIQQSQKPSPSIFMSPSLNTSNNSYQKSKFSNMQSYRTRYQFNLSSNYGNSNNFNISLQQQQQQQQQQYQNQYDYSKTQPPAVAQGSMPHKENQNIYQANQEISQKNSIAPNQQLNPNTFPLSSNQHSKELLSQIIEEEEEEKEDIPYQNSQKINSPNNSLSDDTIPADEDQPALKNSMSDTTNKSEPKNQTQSQQAISQSSGKSQASSINKSQSSSSKDIMNTPKPSPKKDNAVKNQIEAPISSQSQNVSSNNEKNQPNNSEQKAVTSPGMSVIINDDSQNSEDPFAENFLNDDEFHEEESKSIDQQKQQQQHKEPPIQEKPQQESPQQQQQQPQQQKPQPKNSPKTDQFMNDIYSGMFDDISFNHDAFDSGLDMQAAFDAPSQTNSISKKDDNNSKDTNDNKDKKSSNKQESIKDDKQDDLGDLHVPSANSWSFPSSQIQIEGFD